MAGATVSPSPFHGVGLTASNNNSSSSNNNNSGGLAPATLNSYRISAFAERLAMHVRADVVSDHLGFVDLCTSLSRSIDYATANQDVPNKAKDLPLLLKQLCQRKHDPLLQSGIMVLMLSVKGACIRGWFSDKDSEELLILANEIRNVFCSAGDINASNSLLTISTIMSRFYPRLKLGHILAFLEVKPGYGAYMVDFNLWKDLKCSPEEKIRLFVSQSDNIETSSCILSPPQVNFLLNGKAVDGRTNVSMEAVPQMPTNVKPVLKYGTNLLQAVGQFNGNYMIIVAFMSVIANPEPPKLHDYVQPPVAALASDSEIFEGPSRISLNCPISFKRIRTPVKGHTCKHLQCFDFDNYVDMNSRRPSWRCPHCNQYVCFTDIRIDQNMVKVLNEVQENVNDVIFSGNGSWKPIIDTDDHNNDGPKIKSPNYEQQDSPSFSNASPHVMDLTQVDDDIESVGARETEEKKPSLIINQTQPNQNHAAPQPEDEFWFLPPFDMQALGGNSLLSNEYGYGTYPSMARQANRTPNAVQALPVQTPPPTTTSVPPQISRSGGTSQHFSRSHLIQSPLPPSVTQNWNHRERSPTSGQLPQRSQQPNPYRAAAVASLGLHTELQTPNFMNWSPNQISLFLANQTAASMTRRSHPMPAPVLPSSAGASFPANSDRIRPALVPPTRVENMSDLANEPNWRPTGRMRGSLSGQAYNNAFNQFMALPTQPAQAARQMTNMPLIQPVGPSQLQYTSQSQYPPTELGSQ